MSSDCEIAQYYKCVYRTAIKEHKCCECRAKILIGEKYLQVNACWEGRPDVYRQHLLCQKACEYIRDNFEEDCVYYGGLKEWYSDWVKGCYSNEADAQDRAKLWKMILGIKRRERKELLKKSK